MSWGGFASFSEGQFRHSKSTRGLPGADLLYPLRGSMMSEVSDIL